MRVLVVEDELRMAALLRQGLEEHGHFVQVSHTGAGGLGAAAQQGFDVVLLDVGLPDLSGFAVAEALRTRGCSASILMLTAYNREEEIVRGLDLGADDYLTKPFSFPELVARLRSMRRSVSHCTEICTVDDLVIDRRSHRVTRAGHVIDLTRTEYTLLLLLARHTPDVVTRRDLTEGVWRAEGQVSAGALDVLVNALRSKIDAGQQMRLIRTERGTGYALHV